MKSGKRGKLMEEKGRDLLALRWIYGSKNWIAVQRLTHYN